MKVLKWLFLEIANFGICNVETAEEYLSLRILALHSITRDKKEVAST